MKQIFLETFSFFFEICLKFCYLKFLSRTSLCAYSTLFAFVLPRLLTDWNQSAVHDSQFSVFRRVMGCIFTHFHIFGASKKCCLHCRSRHSAETKKWRFRMMKPWLRCKEALLRLQGSLVCSSRKPSFPVRRRMKLAQNHCFCVKTSLVCHSGRTFSAHRALHTYGVGRGNALHPKAFAPARLIFA